MPPRSRSRTFLTLLLSISALLLALASATLLRSSKKDHLTLSPEENRLFDRLASSSSHTSASHARTARTARDANSNSVSSSPDAAPHALSDAAPPSHMRLSGAANNLGAGASTTLVLVVANKAQAREGCADIIKQIFTASTASASSGLPATKYVTYILTGDNPGLELGTAASAPIERANPQLAKTYQAPGHAFDGPEGIETWREDLQRTGETVAYLVDWPYFKLSFVVYKLASGEGGVDGGGGVVRYRLFLSQCPYAFKQFLASENLPTLPGGETLLAGLAGGSEVAFEALDRSLLDRVKIISGQIRHGSEGTASEDKAPERTPVMKEAAYGLFGWRDEHGGEAGNAGQAYPSIKAYTVRDPSGCAARASAVAAAFKGR